MNETESRKWCYYKPWSEWSIRARILAICAGIIGVPAFVALFSAVTMWLWNALMPAIFKLPTIGFWQALGLLILSHILLKGSHTSRAGRSQWKKRQVWKKMREDEAAGGSA